MATRQPTTGLCSQLGCSKPDGTQLFKGMCRTHYTSEWQRARRTARPQIACDVCSTMFLPSRGGILRCSPECAAEGRKRWFRENAGRYRESKNAHMRVYAQSRKAEKVDYDREYYRLNKERRQAQKRAHYIANLAAYREYSATHREAQLARNAKRRAAHPEEAREQRHRRRAKIYGADSFKVKSRDLERARNRAGGRCEYCLTAMGEHWDHRMPLIRGGTHGIGNLVLSCGFCNIQKHAKTVAEWRVWRRRAGLPELAAFL